MHIYVPNWRETCIRSSQSNFSKSLSRPIIWGPSASRVTRRLLKPSLRFDYPLNPPNTTSRPIRDVGKRCNVHWPIRDHTHLRTKLARTSKKISVYLSLDQYTHCGKVFELIDLRFAIYRPTRKCLGGPNHNLLRARSDNRTGKRPPPRA